MWLTLGLACAPEPPGPGGADAVAAGVDAVWAVSLADHPDAFEALTAGARPGWVLLHGHRAAAAFSEFPPRSAGAARAAVAAATLDEDVAALAREVHAATWSTWGARAAAGAAASPPPEAAWLAPWAAACDAPPPLPPAAAAHRDAVRDAVDARNLEALTARLRAPLGDGAQPIFDPCAAATSASLWRALATGGGPWGELSVGDDPAASFLAAWPDRDTLAAGLAAGAPPGRIGPGAPLVAALGADGAGVTADDARDRASALEASLLAVSARILDQAPPDGSALASGLGLVERWREQLALALARDALADGHPAAAAVWVRSVERPPDGLATDPSGAVLLARAELAQGHAREALTALHAAVERDPGLAALEEVLSDLVVLEGLGRPGDSKEDP